MKRQPVTFLKFQKHGNRMRHTIGGVLLLGSLVFIIFLDGVGELMILMRTLGFSYNVSGALGNFFALAVFGVGAYLYFSSPCQTKHKYEIYLGGFYKKGFKIEARRNLQLLARNNTNVEKKEAALIAELYALRAEQGSIAKTSGQYIAELEAELDQEQRISRLEADLATERRMREKYKKMVLGECEHD